MTDEIRERVSKVETLVKRNKTDIKNYRRELGDIDTKVEDLTGEFREFRGAVNTKLWFIFGLIVFIGGIASPLITFIVTKYIA